MQVITAAAGEAFGPRENRRRPGFRQTRGQRHRIGRLAEKVEPDPLAHLGRLIGQQADGLAPLQGLDQRTHAGNIGRRQVKIFAPAPGFDELLQERPLRRPVEDGNRRMGRVVLRGNLETAEMRCQENDSLARLPRGFDDFPAADRDHARRHFFERLEPDRRQFQRLPAGGGGYRTAQLRCKTRLRQILPQVAAVGWREKVGQPAEPGAQQVNQPQGQTAQ